MNKLFMDFGNKNIAFDKKVPLKRRAAIYGVSHRFLNLVIFVALNVIFAQQVIFQ